MEYWTEDRYYRNVAHTAAVVVVVRGQDHVHVLNDPAQRLVQFFWLQLGLEHSPVHLVDHQHGFDPLG